MGNFLQHFPQDFPTTFSHKIFPSWILIGWLPITLFKMLNFHKSLPFLNWLLPLLLVSQEFPVSFSHKNFPQEFPARFSCKISCKIFLQDFLQDFPTRFPTRFSHKNFPQDFLATIFHNIFLQDFPELDPDWLAPHHPIPNAKFPQITAFC